MSPAKWWWVIFNFVLNDNRISMRSEKITKWYCHSLERSRLLKRKDWPKRTNLAIFIKHPQRFVLFTQRAMKLSHHPDVPTFGFCQVFFFFDYNIELNLEKRKLKTILQICSVCIMKERLRGLPFTVVLVNDPKHADVLLTSEDSILSIICVVSIGKYPHLCVSHIERL